MENLFNLFYSTSGICTDTRNIQKDSFFLCLKGSNFNGNQFAAEALNQGAKYVVVDEAEFQTDQNIFLVENVLQFLQDLANFHRKKFSIPVIGITGSNGKTSTKELMKTVLEKKYSVLATEGNLNNHIGVPLTLLKLTQNHEIAIIEMGANKFKDIEELCAIAEPNYGIITNIGKAHLEGFLNFEGVLATKTELYHSIKKNQGQIIVNGDDDVLLNSLPEGVKTIKYGQKQSEGENERECEGERENQITGKLVNLSPFVEMEWSNLDYKSPIIHTKMVGKYNFYNFLSAITVGVLFNVEPNQINNAIEEYSPTNNRSQVKKTERNTLILDCYNANPTSMTSALESFGMIEHPKKFFIIGDMLELGLETQKEHEAILQLTKKLNLKGFTIGNIFSTFTDQQKTFQTTQEAIEYIKMNEINDSLILLKGSRGIGLEKIETVL